MIVLLINKIKKQKQKKNRGENKIPIITIINYYFNYLLLLIINKK
tara:strand:+ start:150 stop:284 length:135 start_codon:yes stop_codon:yes gene_type:complete